MKLRQRQVADPRAQENFEQLEGILSALLGGDYKIRFGTATVTFTAANLSAVLPVSHGFGRVPARVVATESGTTTGSLAMVNSKTTTTFSLQGACPFAAFTGSASFDWIAIG